MVLSAPSKYQEIDLGLTRDEFITLEEPVGTVCKCDWARESGR